ncbi:MAG TPA: dihydrofolate reductase family protein [Candidatus Saccharimonadales bacterium]|nr:dihydrofolate reductase family protein [Candidatus Saccharimonadales bacterium]
MRVLLIAALSADGYIGADEDHRATSWTTKADTRFFMTKTKELGTVIMGRRTFATFNKPLKDRRLIIYTHHPDSITVDGVEATAEEPKELIERLDQEGVKGIAICGGTSIYTQFMNAGIVDELYLTVMPKLFGGGVLLFDHLVNKDLELLSADKLDDQNSVLLHYKLASQLN